MTAAHRFATACLLLAACTAIGAAHAQAMLQVRVEGAVRTAGTFEVPAGSRLAEVALAAMPTREAWPTGASLLRQAAAREQLRLKAALLHDVGVLRQAEDTDTRAVAAALERELQAMPVTGRMPVQLEPRRLEMLPDANTPVADGDRLVYPRRPTTVRITGAVVEPCVVGHAPLRDAAAYLESCATRGADPDWLHVIQPDGSHRRIGIAPWNRSPAQALAPGAVLYVPLPPRALRTLEGDFNAEFAAFLATQPVATQPGAAL
ncbi:hypothetical protein CO641_12020 [Lysobacteraceae bacterium NML91-0213]|nr:hypothetical protein CO641_12020 [Xanthomonadaceae bacterium NML91-0213]